ncbi:protoporphyrinogen oxidase [Tomitella fengzijianii]|uniref:Coproporphyrinogen III oxidase n=1 Tax=Tomitella fengzijianii TaxID=2597660 RepID=A0A516X3D8_9ACTN|nr:protoporphyrinogen oxidase [Tomitella fengzijianii]QDQ97589.1 protoporphyrinogen oxidase [Tomitella fengzijianii]
MADRDWTASAPGNGVGGGPRVAVVGAGVSGLAAAHRVRSLLGGDCRIELFESSGRLGGKLRTVRLGGVPMEVGAEAFLARRPEVPDLLAELGLSGETVHPAGRSPMLRAGGRLHAVPKDTLMGIPADPASLSGLLGASAAEAARRDAAPMTWEPGADITVGELVRSRYGAAVVERCVDPLLGGVYSGSAATIGVRAALPGLARALDDGAPSLARAVAAASAESRRNAAAGPVFGALRGGYSGLVDALARQSGATIRMRTAVTAVERTRGSADGAWRLVVDGGTGPDGSGGSGGAQYGGRSVHADALILALPAPRAAELLRVPVPAAAADAARIPVADSAVVALALPFETELPDASGVLVATGERGVDAKACTLSSNKWPHLAPAGTAGVRLLRLSYGRYGAAEVVGEPDADLVARARSDLRALLGVDDAPVDIHVQRWRGGLPQYGAGHGDRVAAVESAVAAVPALGVAGSAWHGVGVPACIGGARAAAESVVADITR